MEANLVAIFLLGLLGGVHCAGMCGGVVSALSMQADAQRWPLQLAYNSGRIASYGVAGALAGSLGGLGLLFNQVLPIQLALYLAANLMLVALGLSLAGIPLLAGIERVGQHLWRHLQPWTTKLIPANTLPRAFGLGLAWGWLPCGLVYSMLTLALLSGSAARGAAWMLVFGLGTLPNLLLAGMLLHRLRVFSANRAVRASAAVVVLGFGIWGLVNAATLGSNLRQVMLCHPLHITP